MEMIDKYPDKHWCWFDISSNPSITMEIIENNPDKNWDWSYVSRNPNITMEIIEKYITIIEPLSEKIRNIKYDYCKIEYNDDDTFTLATYPYYKNKLEREIS